MTGQRLRSADYIGQGVPMKTECREAIFFPIHSHDYFELEILLQGSGSMILNDGVYPLQPGSVYLLTPADFHEVHLESGNLLWNIAFDQTVPAPQWLEALFSLGEPVRQVDSDTLQRLDTAASLLSREQEPRCQSLLLEYLLKAAGLWAEAPAVLSPVRRAMLYMETYFRENPTLAQTAAHVGLSPSYFGALFRQETGETYISYLNQCKVRCAVMLLQRGKSVTEACFEAGFGSLSGFRYIFHQKTGQTPSAYL